MSIITIAFLLITFFYFDLCELGLSKNFGNYKSFLEVSFGTNFLFALWENLTLKMENWRIKIISRFQSWTTPYIIDILYRREEGCSSFCNTIKERGRSIGIIFSFFIAISLFIFNDNTEINKYHLLLIVISSIPLPISFLIMIDRSIWMLLVNWLSFKDFPSSPATPPIVEAATAAAAEARKEE